MELTGDITGYVDVAQVVLYVFWLFFFVLIFWLHREGKREGYPLESDMGIGGLREGFPLMASPKTFSNWSLVRRGTAGNRSDRAGLACQAHGPHPRFSLCS